MKKWQYKSNSHLSGSNITIKSTEDTTVRGGVVTADNKLTVEAGGDLTVESVQDKSKNHSNTAGISAGESSGGVNADISSGNKKWVTEQTSLTGGSVDIYVEDKTTLTGAVIASTTDNLTLDTGSLEYSNIKDKDTSSNIGGGVNAGAGSGSVNATYGFTDIRQTNFATIGDGTITVRDDKAELTGLNRDVTISQYNTKDGGLQGGFTVDTATVQLITNPDGTVINTAKAVEKGSMIAYSITEGVVKAVDVGVDSELGMSGTLEAVVNARKDVLTIVAIADSKALREGVDKALEKDAASLEGVVNEVSELVQKSDDVADDKISHVNLYQGDETDNAMGDYAAAYDQSKNETYLNTEGTDISQGGDIMNSIFKEAQRKDNYDNSIGLDYGQQNDLAAFRGDQAENLWNRFSETASTTSNVGGVYNWNNSNADSDTLVNGSNKANSLDTSEGGGVVARSKPMIYCAAFEEYDKKGTVGVKTEQIDKGDTIAKIVEGNVKALTDKGIKTDFGTEYAKLMANNPQITDPDNIKAGDRIITEVVTGIEPTTLGKVIEYLPNGKGSLTITRAIENSATNLGGGGTIGYSFNINLAEGTFSDSIDTYLTLGESPSAWFTGVAGFGYGKGSSSGSVSATYNHISGEIDYGDNYFSIQAGGSTSNYSATLSKPITSKPWHDYKIVNGTETIIRTEQQKYVESVQKYKLND